MAVGKLPGLLRVHPGEHVRLRDGDAGRRFGWTEEEAGPELVRMKARLGELQYKLYADGRFGLLHRAAGDRRRRQGQHDPPRLLGLQSPGLHGHGLQGAVGRGAEARLPVARAPARAGRGEVGIFNRSHYEDVLVVRVDSLAPKPVWQKRYEEINEFEQQLTHADIGVVKIFLHISRDEQKRRFQQRLDDPRKHWKFDPTDVKKREQWPQYQRAFEDVFRRCSTDARAVVRGAGELQVAQGPGRSRGYCWMRWRRCH